MNLHEHFLPQDMVQASKEYKCVKACMKHVRADIEKGDLEMAKSYTIDMLKSIHELSKLEDRKKRSDRQKLLFQGMPTVTHIEIARMMDHE